MKITIVDWTKEESDKFRKAMYENDTFDEDFSPEAHEKYLEVRDMIYDYIDKNKIRYKFFDFSPVEMKRTEAFVKKHNDKGCHSKRPPKHVFRDGDLCAFHSIICSTCNEEEDITDTNML